MDGVAQPQPEAAVESQTVPPPEPEHVIPLPYLVKEDGKKVPLPGVESLFLRGNTVEAMGLNTLATPAAEGGQQLGTVPKEKLLADIQFQGAISDWHPIKAKIVAADYDPLVVRLNEDDRYGDGNNFEIACSKEAADLWAFIEQETQRIQGEAAEAAARAAAEQAMPRTKRKREVQPWKDLGSEAEIEAAAVSTSRDPITVVVQRQRRHFGSSCSLADTDAHELWNSTQMECRPFKDANYELRKMEREAGAQAVPVLREAAVQATGGRPCPGSTQYEAQDMTDEDKVAAIQSEGFKQFLEHIRPRYEEVLLQNAVADIFSDDLANLADEEGPGGSRQSSAGVAEAQSFTDLVYSKGKVVSAIQWLPHRKGVVAVSCTDPASHHERLNKVGRLSSAYILIWNFKDPIHPEYVLESPHEVLAFQYNPANPEIIAGGCYNGQIVVWDTSGEHDRLIRAKNHKAAPPSVSEDGGNDETVTAVIRHKYMSAVEYSHISMVTDLQWLPGLEVDKYGKAYPLRGSSAPGNPGTLNHAASLNPYGHRSNNTSCGGSTTAGTPHPGSSAGGAPLTPHGARDCCFFATTAADGKIMFWDVRIEKLMKKGSRKVEDFELLWRPIHSVHLLSLQGMDFGGLKLCFDFGRLDGGSFVISSADGELLTGNFIRPDGEENPDYCRHCHMPHAGPVVCLARSPFIEDLVLSVGDWSFRLWLEGSSTPVFVSPYHEDFYTTACWSPTRPGVIYLTDASGDLFIWDLLDRSHEPALKLSAASSAIQSISFNTTNLPPAAGATAHAGQTATAGGGLGGAAASGGGAGGGGGNQHTGSAQQLLALGDSTGVLHLMELPRNLRRPLPNEKKLMSQFLARETARVADVAARQPLRTKVLKDQEEARKANEDLEDKETLASRDKDAATATTRRSSNAGGQSVMMSTSGGGAVHNTQRISITGNTGMTTSRTAAGGADAVDQAEKAYRKLEHEFKVQLGLIEA